MKIPAHERGDDVAVIETSRRENYLHAFKAGAATTLRLSKRHVAKIVWLFFKSNRHENFSTLLKRAQVLEA